MAIIVTATEALQYSLQSGRQAFRTLLLLGVFPDITRFCASHLRVEKRPMKTVDINTPKAVHIDEVQSMTVTTHNDEINISLTSLPSSKNLPETLKIDMIVSFSIKQIAHIPAVSKEFQRKINNKGRRKCLKKMYSCCAVFWSWLSPDRP
jgi:hypothetical protein